MKESKTLNPVFIGGCDRSGTTMLGAIIGAHSRCLCTPESQFITHIFRQKSFNPDGVNHVEVMRYIKKNKRFRLLWPYGIDTVRRFPNESTPPYSDFLIALILEYANIVGKPDIKLWVDHTPSNVKRALTLNKLFPDAKFIHIIRDGRGVATSLIQLPWGPNNIIRAAEFWASRCAAGLALETHFGSNKVLRVYYEDVLKHTKPAIRQICSFLGLDFEPPMLEGGGYTPNKYIRKQHSLVGQHPDHTRANSWRDKLTRREIEIFEFLTGEMLSTLGYPLEFGLRAKRLKKSELRMFQIQNVLARIANNLRQKARIFFSLYGSKRKN